MVKRKIGKVRCIMLPIKFFNELELFPNQEVEIIVEYGKICIKK